ncbi:MAG: alpha/beta hydrolase [Bacteroidales bacterium]
MNSSTVEKVTLFSKALAKEMPMLVYLPPSYNDQTFFPVLYFLHGRNGNENIMFDVDINNSADKLVSCGEIAPMVIVCPRIENSRGVNSSAECKEVPDTNGRIINTGRYEDYIIEEVIPFIDKTFNTVKDRKGRFIGGVSGGGHAALHNALRHQQMFSKVGGHMPAVELKLEEEDQPYYQDIYGWEKYDPIYIATNNTISLDMEVYLDAGDKDEGQFYEGCSILHNILRGKGINSQYHLFQGNHSVEYIKSNIDKYLKFYGC